MSSTTTFISSTSTTISNVNANAAAAAAAAAANTPFITTPLNQDAPVCFTANNENYNIDDCHYSPLRAAVQSAVSKYLASRNNASPKTSIKLDGISFNSIKANTLAELLQLNPTNLSTLPSAPPPSRLPTVPPPLRHEAQPFDDLSWRMNSNNAEGKNYYYYEEIEGDLDTTDEVEMDEDVEEYCATLNEARCQIVNKLRAKLQLMRQERKRTQAQLAKLQHLQRMRALRGKINKGTLSKLKHQGQQDGKKLASGLAVLQLSSSSVSSSCTTEDVVHCHPVKKVDKCHRNEWMMSSSSPVSAEDDSLDIDDSNGNGNIKNIGNGNANGIIQAGVEGIIDGCNTNSIGHK